MVQLNDIDDLMQRAGLSSWGDVIHQKVDNLKCPRCGDNCYLTIVLIKDNSTVFKHKIVDYCHNEFSNLVNDTLPLFLKEKLE